MACRSFTPVDQQLQDRQSALRAAEEEDYSSEKASKPADPGSSICVMGPTLCGCVELIDYTRFQKSVLRDIKSRWWLVTSWHSLQSYRGAFALYLSYKCPVQWEGLHVVRSQMIPNGEGDRYAVEHDRYSDWLQQVEKWTETNLGIFIKFKIYKEGLCAWLAKSRTAE